MVTRMEVWWTGGSEMEGGGTKGSEVVPPAHGQSCPSKPNQVKRILTPDLFKCQLELGRLVLAHGLLREEGVHVNVQVALDLVHLLALGPQLCLKTLLVADELLDLKPGGRRGQMLVCWTQQKGPSRNNSPLWKQPPLGYLVFQGSRSGKRSRSRNRYKSGGRSRS